MTQLEPFTWSPFVGEIEPVTASDEEIAEALADAELPPLLPALAYMTGDLELLRDDLRVDPALAALPQGGLTDEQQAAIRSLALEVLRSFRDSGSRPAPAPGEADLLTIMEWAVGGEPMAEYLPLLSEELGIRGRDARAPQWYLAQAAPGRAFEVVVIGAGMSGILASHRLGQAGISHVVIEKNEDVGGTWLENTYPGCRVDNPNHNYSYSFAQRHDWPYHFSTQQVLLDYFRSCAEVFEVRDRVRFSTEVVALAWSEEASRWTLHLRQSDGSESSLEADAVISAVGQLNRPLYPDIPGLERFEGPSFHSACWDHDVDLRDQRVAVIGTGASAVQFVPEIAPAAGHLTVFQRTPPWLAPTPDYHDKVSEGLRWLYTHVPAYSEWNRFWIFWRMGDAVLAHVSVGPGWEGDGASVSAENDLMRMLLTAYLQVELGDRPDLLEHAIPRYPPGAKRILRDNGVWPQTLRRDDVELVSEKIVEVTPTGVVTADGREHEADVLIFGTGFQASNFLTPMQVRGRGGVDLHERWDGEARAYLGVTVPEFPNLFLLYGPNTNIVLNGSIIYFSECGVRYILGCLRLLLEGGHKALEVRSDVHDEFNRSVDEQNAAMAWGASDVNSWYKSASGRVSQNWPFSLLEYWKRTLRADPGDYVTSG